MQVQCKSCTVCKLVLLLGTVVTPASPHPSPSPSRHFRNHTCHHFSHLRHPITTCHHFSPLVTACYRLPHFSLLSTLLTLAPLVTLVTASHYFSLLFTLVTTRHHFSPLVTTFHHLSLLVNTRHCASILMSLALSMPSLSCLCVIFCPNVMPSYHSYSQHYDEPCIVTVCLF